MVNKLPSEMECPADRLLLAFIDTHLTKYYEMGFTPNQITTLSLICGCLATYAIYRRHYEWGAVLYALAYYFDCVDGKLARQYGMVTLFGDYYDHFSDVFKLVIVLGALYHNRNLPISAIQDGFKTIVIFFTIMVGLHLGYQERVYAKTGETNTLDLLTYMTNHDSLPEETIHFTKYFGNGTFTLVVFLGIIMWRHFKK